METIKEMYQKAEAERERKITPSAFSVALWKYRGEEGALIPLLQAAQDQYSYIPESVMYRISDVTGIPASDIYGVVTFYKQFKLTPPGKHIIRVCDGTACHVNGSTTILKVLEELLKVHIDETTPDGVFTLQSVACLGCCSLAPVMVVDEETYGRLNPGSIRNILDTYRKKAKSGD